MNETVNDPNPGPPPTAGQDAPHPGPSYRNPQDLDRLRRSTTDRYVAGVAGGLGRHFDVDPTIIRVLLVVLTFFGGAGVLIYAVCWLIVPEDTAQRAPLRVGTEPRRILLLAAAGIAFLLAVGDAFNGFNAGWPIAVIAVFIALIMITRDRRAESQAQQGDGQVPVAAPAGPSYAAADTGVEDTRVLDEQLIASSAQPPAWQPPVAPAMVPPRPKRTGIVWFWPALALIALALGILGIYDDNHVVVDGAYPALALAITGAMLVVGSFVGRPGGLALVGVLSSLALSASVAVGGSFGVDAKDVHESPRTAAAVQPEYTGTVGAIELDLTRVADVEALAGREIDLRLRTGEITVIVPHELNVEIDAVMDFAGGIAVPGDDSGGVNHEVHKVLTSVPASDSAPLELDIEAKFGQITVEQR